MESSNQLDLMGILRAWLRRVPRPAPTKTRSNAITLEGKVEPLEGMEVYRRDISISRRGGEKGSYYLNCTDIARFIDTLYPSYVRGGDDGRDIQVSFSFEKPSEQPPIMFRTYKELIEYSNGDVFRTVISAPRVSIEYNGANTDVPKTISIIRKPFTRPTTDYSVEVKAPNGYNFVMIDVCVGGYLFKGRIG